MEPRIQYATTSDGVRIAYWTMGSGRPLVVLRPGTASHIVNELTVPELRGFDESLAEGRTLVRYDPRGCGISERSVDDYSHDALLRDVLAVIDAIGCEEVDVLAMAVAASIAVLFAARHPQRLGRLIILGTQGDFPKMEAFLDAMEPLMERYPDDYHQIYMHLVVGWEHSDLASRLSAAYGHTVTPEQHLRMRKQDLAFAFDALTPLVRAPTLLVGRLEGGALGRAGRIPGAQIASVPRDVGSYLVDWEPHVAAIKRFLAETEPVSAQESPANGVAESQHGTAAILFALRAIIRDNWGTPIDGKLLGDGVLATFTSASQAIAAALACGKAGDEGGLPLHLGLHAGDVIREDDPGGRSNVYGGAVNIASRISGLSAPGEVLVSDTVRSLARTSAGVRFEDRGEQALKGVGEPVRVWRVVSSDR